MGPLKIVLAGSLLLAAVPAAADDAAYAAFDARIAATKAAMMTDPPRALASAQRALVLARALPAGSRAEIARATAQWLEGEALIRVNAPARAAPLIEEALATVRREAPDSKLAGDLMRSRGAIAAISGRVREALDDFQAAFRIFVRAGETRSQAIALQDIGAIYLDAGDYQQVLRYYARSAEVFPDDPYLLLSTHNNRAQVYRELKRYDAATSEYRRGLEDARRLDSPQLEAEILTNLAATLADAGRLGEASAAVERAGRLAAAGEAPFVAGVRAKIAAARGDDRAAARLLTGVFAGANLAATPMPYREFHKLAAAVFERLGDEKASLAHLKAYTRLDNEARALIASTSAQLVSARFDFASQNLRIANLKQGQLARDIKIERQQSRLRTVILGGLLGAGAIVLALFVAAFLSIRRSRNQVRAANADLTVSNNKLEKALAAKSEFLAMTSHEIRTPLNGILGMTQVILARPTLDPEMRGQVGVVHSAGEAMKALVDDILDVSKMERGEIELDRAEADLHRLLGDLDQLWQGQAALKGLRLTVDYADAPRRIVTDDARLRQIVSNLVSNAVKFTQQGSVAVTASARDDRLEIRVADTGIGIAPEHHAAIFETFRQVDAATTRTFGGTGLGLAIVKRLTMAFGGTITIESTPGKGSIFRVDLPLERAVANDEAAPALLLAEPNMLRQSMLRSLLTPHFGEIAIVSDEAAAMTAIAAGGCRQLLFDADSLCAGDIDRAHKLAEAAIQARVSCTVMHPAATGWDIVGDCGAHILAKPLDGARLLASLTSIKAMLRAA